MDLIVPQGGTISTHWRNRTVVRFDRGALSGQSRASRGEPCELPSPIATGLRHGTVRSFA